MSQPLKMDEMGPGISSRDLEACRMSNEAPADDKVAARVRATVAGDFKPEHVNGFPMRPDKGSIDLVSSSLAYGFDFGISSIFLKLVSTRAGFNRCSVFEASGKGGRGRP